MYRFRSRSIAPCEAKDSSPRASKNNQLLHQLETNQMTRLNLMKALRNQRDESCEELMGAMKKNKSVRDVYLGPYFYASLNDHVRSKFIRSLGQDLRHLRSLSIGTLDHTRAYITGDCIGCCIAKAKQLHTVRIERDITLSTSDEAACLANGLRCHPTLRRISLLNLHPTATETSSLDVVLLALSSNAELESLQLGISVECERSLSATPEAVASIAQHCPKLSWLYMARFPLQDRHMMCLFDAIGTQQESLKVLDFPQSHQLTIQSWKALWELLECNVVLESVNMSAPPWAKRAKSLIYAKLALNRDGKRRKLRECKNLETWIGIAHKLTPCDINVLYAMVRENPSMCNRSFRSME